MPTPDPGLQAFSNYLASEAPAFIVSFLAQFGMWFGVLFGVFVTLTALVFFYRLVRP